MSNLQIPWAPRVVMAGRTFRLPVQSPDEGVTLEAGAFHVIASRWSARDSARLFYLRAPETGGDHTIQARWKGEVAAAAVQVRTLEDLRRPHAYNGAQWPRRWPLGKPWKSAKTRQTLQSPEELEMMNVDGDFILLSHLTYLQHLPGAGTVNERLVRWWASQTDETVWGQLPLSEWPKAHFTNVHQGCPKCGTAIFRFGGFYPWQRSHTPCDFKSRCPACGAAFPSNDLAAGDFTSGDYADDGYGYFDAEGHVYLFAATYHRDLAFAYQAGIQALAYCLGADGFDAGMARRLGLMLLRWAAEEVYQAAAPQFRYGPSKGAGEPWVWGQPDWASEADPVAGLARKGSLIYGLNTGHVSERLAIAYDTVWPFLREDRELVSRAQALGLGVQGPEDVVGLIEEMLACLLQCVPDRAAMSNPPRESRGALMLMRGLDRGDGQEVMDWLYDAGTDRLRTFGTNDFFPDGAPPEATGGYNSLHADGLFNLEYHLRHLREGHPGAYPESRYPSLVGDARAPRVVRQPHEMVMIGKSYFQLGDGTAPGCQAERSPRPKGGSLLLEDDCYYAPMDLRTLERAAAYTGDPVAREILEAARRGAHRRIGTTVHDGVGIAILRTGETPERAAAGIVYGDPIAHRHVDLLDVQLFAFGRPFLTDLGYPWSWAHVEKWEGHWATHNTVWGSIPDVPGRGIAGRGRLVRTLFTEGVQILDVAAERWAWDGNAKRWVKPGVTYRRLIALVETDGEGVALVDLSRIRGGTEHWRVCRGLEGRFVTEGFDLTPRGGTVADPDGVRGGMEGLGHPDYEGLACMDDVAEDRALASWKGGWQSRIEPGVYLDLHQVRASTSTAFMTARATSMMGGPGDSAYEYRAAIWRRRPADAQDVTCVDLVFEPRAGRATLKAARGISAMDGGPGAGGVELQTWAGRKVAIYWAPDAGPEEVTTFSDGTELRGGLASVVEGRVVFSGATAFRHQGRSWAAEDAHQRGRIVALDREACRVDVAGLVAVKKGDRVRINPDGRGHSYEVEEVEVLKDGGFRLRLDVTSVLGRATVASAGPEEIELGMFIVARTGNLHGTRLVAEGSWMEIAEATNPEPGRTRVRIGGGDAEKMTGFPAGTWVSVVDYGVGDVVLCEPTRGG